MNHKIGILQGRLSKAPKGRLQFFPKDFNLEFKIAKQIGFDYIEMFTERKYNRKNPIWTKYGVNDLKRSCLKKNNLNFYSFVDDYILKKKIDKNLFKYYQKLIHRLKKLNIKILTVPFYGNNKITKKNYQNYVKFLNFLNKKCLISKIHLSIESNITPELFKSLKKSLNKKIYFTFDTGNRVLLKRSMKNDIFEFKSDIKHIHIKDKDSKKRNVQLGKGLVDFKSLFIYLKKINYKEALTLETNRGNNPILSASRNLKFVKRYLK